MSKRVSQANVTYLTELDSTSAMNLSSASVSYLTNADYKSPYRLAQVSVTATPLAYTKSPYRLYGAYLTILTDSPVIEAQVGSRRQAYSQIIY